MYTRTFILLIVILFRGLCTVSSPTPSFLPQWRGSKVRSPWCTVVLPVWSSFTSYLLLSLSFLYITFWVTNFQRVQLLFVIFIIRCVGSSSFLRFVRFPCFPGVGLHYTILPAFRFHFSYRTFYVHYLLTVYGLWFYCSCQLKSSLYYLRCPFCRKFFYFRFLCKSEWFHFDSLKQQSSTRTVLDDFL